MLAKARIIENWLNVVLLGFISVSSPAQYQDFDVWRGDAAEKEVDGRLK